MVLAVLAFVRFLQRRIALTKLRRQVYKTTVIRSAQDLCPAAASQEEAWAVTEQQWYTFSY